MGSLLFIIQVCALSTGVPVVRANCPQPWGAAGHASAAGGGAPSNPASLTLFRLWRRCLPRPSPSSLPGLSRHLSPTYWFPTTQTHSGFCSPGPALRPDSWSMLISCPPSEMSFRSRLLPSIISPQLFKARSHLPSFVEQVPFLVSPSLLQVLYKSMPLNEQDSQVGR